MIIELIKKGNGLYPSLEKDEIYFDKLVQGQIVQ